VIDYLSIEHGEEVSKAGKDSPGPWE